MHDVSHSVRLPSRCPMCKGAVIERTSSAAYSGFLWFHCVFCNHWWKFRTDEARGNPDGELTGEVFIVTKRGVTYTLDAVPVSAIPEELAKKHLKSKMLQRELEIEKLQGEIDRLSETLQAAQADEHRLWKILEDDENNSEHAIEWSAAYKKTKAITKEVAILHAQRQHLLSDEYLFEGLPSGISAGKTDANGHFSLTIPRDGQYVIAARGPRDMFRDTQPYWFVSVSLGEEPSKRLVLTNDNVIGASEEDWARQ